MTRLLAIFFVIGLYGCGSDPKVRNTQKKDSPSDLPVKIDSLRKGVIYVKQMTVIRKSAYDDFYVRLDDSSYSCNYKGIMHSADTLGNRVGFLFDLKAEYLIDVVYFIPLEQNLFYVSWQETDHTGVYSYYAVYERGNNEAVWKRSIKAHSPGQPVIDSDNVYISSLGMIGKVGLKDGSLRWKMDSLFDPISLRFKRFDRPVLYTNTTCFFDFPIKGKKSRRDSIWVNDVSGKLIR